MARMSIDDMLGRDPRITVLSTILGWTRRETAGCLILEVWPICYDQRTHLISERIIDAAAGCAGFAKAMVEAELAVMDRSGKVHVKGARERIEYLNHKSSAGRQGGLKSGEARAQKSKQTPSTGEADVKQRGSTPQARGNPSATASASPSVPPSSPVPASDPPPALVLRVAEPDGSPGHRQVVARFDELYKQRTGGASPSWGKDTGGMIKTLLGKHTGAEIIRRIEILFCSPPRFLQGSTPDVQTLVQHFDKLATPSQSAERKNPTQIALEELARIESEEK